MVKKINGPISMFLVNSALLWLANMTFPQNFVLGSYLITPTKAIFLSAIVWTALTWTTQPIMTKYFPKVTSVMGMMLGYLTVNVVSLWLITRVSAYTGVGISSFWWLLVFAFIANNVQYMNWMLMTKLKLAKM